MARVIHYALEQLYADQEHDFVVDTVPAVLAWVPGRSRGRRRQPFQFHLERRKSRRSSIERLELHLEWDLEALSVHDADVRARAQRMSSGRTAQREHVTELAAYGLALVVISKLLPGHRVASFRKGLPPDILFDVSPGRVRGVEVAGRSRGGLRALAGVAEDKTVGLAARDDVAEAHLSLWCGSPRVTLFLKVKP